MAQSRGQRFITNVLWNWLGVAANLVVGVLLSPYIIRKLGEERYGIWALIFAVLDYFWFFDLGLNTAVTNFCARYLALGESNRINEVINTAFFYFSVISLVIMGATLALAHNVERFFHVSAAYRQEFSTLITITGMSWGLCIVLHMFVSALDGFQRFDLTGRVWVLMLVLRSAGYAWMLKLGFGLVEMGAIFVVCQILYYILNFYNFVGVFPELRFSRKLVKWPVFKQIVSYGMHSFVANCCNLVLLQSGPVLIGHYLPTAFVGYYALPARLLQYAVDGVARIGMVTRSSAAELGAIGEHENVLRLGIYSNRYSFTLFMPLVIMLLIYGRELIRRWVGPQFEAHSVPLLPIFIAATAFVLAGQFNSSALLFGIGRHDGYARGLMVEATANIVLMILVIPRYGIYGAACVWAGLMILVRGIYTPWLVCRSLRFSFVRYMASIYLRPVLTGIPVLAFAWYCKNHWIAGRTWPQLFLAGALIAAAYLMPAFFTSIERDHRGLLLSRVPVLGRRFTAT